MPQPELIGTLLAGTDDETQAEVLNEFVAVLTVVCKPKEFASLSMQGFWIAKRLRPATVEFFREMVAAYDHLRAVLPAEVARLVEDKERLRREVVELQEKAGEF